MVISVGYRVKSSEGIRFRQWATQTLKNLLIEGAAINEKRLIQIDRIAHILARSSDDMVSGIVDALQEFSNSLSLLDDYDHQALLKPQGEDPSWILTYEEARSFINTMRFGEASSLFGAERDNSFKGVVGWYLSEFCRARALSELGGKSSQLTLSGCEGSYFHGWKQKNSSCAFRLFH